MVLFDLYGTEDNPHYQQLAVSNGGRHYDLLLSLIDIAINTDCTYLSQRVIKALNYAAVVCLHSHAGVYRSHEVSAGKILGTPAYRVQCQMDEFVNFVNRNWERTDPVWLGCFVLWRLCRIHPFENGNGRAARAACYYVICLRLGGPIIGNTILPELLRLNHAEYVGALVAADESLKVGTLDLSVLQALVSRLLQEQINSATAPTAPNAAAQA